MRIRILEERDMEIRVRRSLATMSVTVEVCEEGLCETIAAVKAPDIDTLHEIHAFAKRLVEELRRRGIINQWWKVREA